jgi:hypothetical protein
MPGPGPCPCRSRAPRSGASPAGGLGAKQAGGEIPCALGLAAQHAGELGDTAFVVKEGELSECTLLMEVFGNEEVGWSTGSHGGEVGDADHLVMPAEVAHFLANRMGGFTSQIGIDLIEDEKRDAILRGECGFESQHDTRHFA